MWQAGLAVYLAYGTLLRYAIDPTPGPFLSDGVTLLYWAYWLFLAPKQWFAWRYSLYWLSLPALGATYLVLRAELTLSNAFLALLGCYVIGLAVIRLSRGLTPDSTCCH